MLRRRWFPSPHTNLAAIAFHRDPEITVCLRIPIPGSAIYAIFDPHPRENHPSGPAFTLSNQIDQIDHISTFPTQVLLKTPTSWVSQDTYGYLLKPITPHGSESVTNAFEHYLSRVLQLQRQDPPQRASGPPCLPLITGQPEILISSLQRNSTIRPRREMGIYVPAPALVDIDANVSNFNSHRSKQKQKSHSLSSRTASSSTADGKENIPPVPITTSLSDGSITLFLTDEQLEVPIYVESPDVADDVEITRMTGASTSQDELPSKRLSRHNALRRSLGEKGSLGQSSTTDVNWELALLLQLQEEEEIAASVAHQVSTDNAWIVALQKRKVEEAKFLQGASSSTDVFSELDWELAAQLQRAEAGHRSFRSFSTGSPRGCRLSRSSTRSPDSRNVVTVVPAPVLNFECGICGETHDPSLKITLAGCSHSFCRDCLSGHTRSKLEDGKYPIFCPECLIERSRTTKSREFSYEGEVKQKLIYNSRRC